MAVRRQITQLQFGALVDKFRADLADMAGQCVGGSAGGVPWICGDTTYFWKQKNESAYQTVYGSYKNKRKRISIRTVHDR
ncbi:hypothetical protein ECDEC10D_1289 [Escherichia coli DEC10D]|nr:hypothetical protein ECDEC10D_1289 [Escherichia coli DEC10D]